MKKLFYLLITILSGIVLSACTISDDSADGRITPQNTKYSYDDLKSVEDDINEYFQSFDEESYKKDKLCQIICGVSIVDGYVDVGLTELTDENITLFKEKVSDSDAIVFRQGTKGSLD